MDQSTLVSIVLGGLGGALAAELIQIVREAPAHRRRVRGAARVLRTEIVANSGLVATALQLGGIPQAALWSFRNDRFERQIDILIAELSRTDTAILLSFDSVHAIAKGILERMQAGTANATDVAWLETTWGPSPTCAK